MTVAEARPSPGDPIQVWSERMFERIVTLSVQTDTMMAKLDTLPCTVHGEDIVRLQEQARASKERQKDRNSSVRERHRELSVAQKTWGDRLWRLLPVIFSSAALIGFLVDKLF